MRIDTYLNRVCILKSRSLAREACDRGKVLLNGKVARGKESVSIGDRIRLDLVLKVLELDVLVVPTGRLSKKAAKEAFTLVTMTEA
jgi:ribosomal 50S subunit-recycling heat shock protein